MKKKFLNCFQISTIQKCLKRMMMPRTLRTTFFWLWLYWILASWNSEVGRAAMKRHLENMVPNQEDQREQEEEEGSGEAAVQ
jgi:hypothetical protein